MTDPKTQRFNAVLETLDGLTLFRHDRVTDPEVLLNRFISDTVGPEYDESTLIVEFMEAARALGYGDSDPKKKIPKSS